jgi:hypothetical protein
MIKIEECQVHRVLWHHKSKLYESETKIRRRERLIAANDTELWRSAKEDSLMGYFCLRKTKRRRGTGQENIRKVNN